MTRLDSSDKPRIRLGLSVGHLDRTGSDARDASKLQATWALESTEVLAIHQGRSPILGTDRPRLQRLPAHRVATDLQSAGPVVFLGTDPMGAALFLQRVDNQPEESAGWVERWEGLREVGMLLDPLDQELLTIAVAIDAWHTTHQHCPRCGAQTLPEKGGWMRRCARDGSEHYPRTDPAVIMLIRDGEDRALLGRQAAWPQGWMSTLAGFVAPGESAEVAVRREVREEVGVEVGEVEYRASQPWPFPASLMLGFTGQALTTTLLPDPAEIAEAAWFSRAALSEAGERGQVLLPPPISIARSLIEDWYGQPLPNQWLRGRPR